MTHDPHESQEQFDAEVAAYAAIDATAETFGTYAEELQRQFSGDGDFSTPCPHGSQS